MSRVWYGLLAALLLAGGTGCSMCAHPYDYCGPTEFGCYRNECDVDPRAGSILCPHRGPLYSTVPAIDQPSGEAVPTPTPNPLGSQARVSGQRPAELGYGPNAPRR
jgi:hypothetical protein